MQFKIYGISEKGAYRDDNQDSVYFHINANNNVMAIVCDGMGGHAGGKEASNIVTKYFHKEFASVNLTKKTDSKVLLWLKTKIKASQKLLEKTAKKNPKLDDMGTTIVVVLIINKILYTYHAGDSRLYFIDPNYGLIRQITLDHNLKNYDNDLFVINNRALVHALGPNKFSTIDELSTAYQKIILDSNSPICLFLCTDGIYEVINAAKLYEILSLNIDIKQKVEKIIAKAKNNDSKDNMSCIIIENDKWKQ